MPRHNMKEESSQAASGNRTKVTPVPSDCDACDMTVLYKTDKGEMSAKCMFVENGKFIHIHIESNIVTDPPDETDINVSIPNNKELLFKFLLNYLQEDDDLTASWVCFDIEDDMPENGTLCFALQHASDTLGNDCRNALQRCVDLFGFISI